MKKRRLGNTGMEVSEIAFGGVEIGMPYGIGIHSERDMVGEKEAVQLLHKAIDEGINFFDTARMYGNSEAIMGKAFGKRRDELIICTKCRHLRNNNGPLPSGDALHKMIHSSLEESLSALLTDYLDVFMLHQGDLEILKNEEIADILCGLKKQGKVRAIGVSTYLVEETDLALDAGVWDVIQIPFNLLDQRQEPLFEKASKQGTGLVIRSVLLKGLLSNRGKNLPKPLVGIEKHIEKYSSLMEGVSLPVLATKFALSFEQVAAVLVGIDKPAYLREAVSAGNGKYLESQALEQAKSLAYPNPEFINLPHWAKMGWLT